MGPAPGLVVSAAAGLLTFLSPCVLPLLPSYLAFLGGFSTNAELVAANRLATVTRTILFVTGFTVVFVLLGLAFSGSGLLFTEAASTINVIAGVLVIVLGLHVIFDFLRLLSVELRPAMTRPAGHAGAVLTGMAFGAGWTPCIGPVLASILMLAGTSGSIAAGVLHLTAFSLGLGVPFVLAGVFVGRVRAVVDRLTPHLRTIRVASGLVLIGVGILMILGRLAELPARVLAAGYRLDAWAAAHPLLSRSGASLIVLVIGLLPVTVRLLRSRGPAIAAVTTAIAAATLAALNGAGVIDMTAWLAGWLRFAGL